MSAQISLAFSAWGVDAHLVDPAVNVLPRARAWRDAQQPCGERVYRLLLTGRYVRKIESTRQTAGTGSPGQEFG